MRMDNKDVLVFVWSFFSHFFFNFSFIYFFPPYLSNFSLFLFSFFSCIYHIALFWPCLFDKLSRAFEKDKVKIGFWKWIFFKFF